jgi:hypothetical protein
MPSFKALTISAFLAGTLGFFLVSQIHARYSFSLQAPVRLQFQWPLVVAHRILTEEAVEAQSDQGRPLTAYQQYACEKFGAACRVALAIQRAENPKA